MTIVKELTIVLSLVFLIVSTGVFAADPETISSTSVFSAEHSQKLLVNKTSDGMNRAVKVYLIWHNCAVWHNCNCSEKNSCHDVLTVEAGSKS